MTPHALAWTQAAAMRDRHGHELRGHQGRWRIAGKHVPLGFDGRVLSFCPRCHRGTISSPCVIVRMRSVDYKPPHIHPAWGEMGIFPGPADTWVFSCELNGVPAALHHDEYAVSHHISRARAAYKEEA